MIDHKFNLLWPKIQHKLNSRLPGLKDRIQKMGQTRAIENRKDGHQFSDSEIFRGTVKAVLSNITDWSKVERVLGELEDLFKGFDLQYYSKLTESQIDEEFIPWFLERSAGGLAMRRDLKNLIGTSRKLLEHSLRSGSLENYFASLIRFNGNDPIELARVLGSNKSPYKLAGFGIPIASEMLKNIGYDVSKPDRLINRAIGSFGLVSFLNWKDKSDQKPPIVSENEVTLLSG